MKPLLNKWTIKKFRQRGDISLIITKNDITLYHENIRYLLFPYENKIGLFLYMKGFNENKDAFIDLAFLFLDNALGEYDVVTKIGGIEFKEYNTEDFEKSKSIETFIDEFDNMKI
jgi:hypothetical protein